MHMGITNNHVLKEVYDLSKNWVSISNKNTNRQLMILEQIRQDIDNFNSLRLSILHLLKLLNLLNLVK